MSLRETWMKHRDSSREYYKGKVYPAQPGWLGGNPDQRILFGDQEYSPKLAMARQTLRAVCIGAPALVLGTLLMVEPAQENKATPPVISNSDSPTPAQP